MIAGLGWAQWLTIAALVGGLWLTFWMMARASVAYQRAREARERAAEMGNLSGEDAETALGDTDRKEES